LSFAFLFLSLILSLFISTHHHQSCASPRAAGRGTRDLRTPTKGNEAAESLNDTRRG
jgi:hypothetical protein